MQHYDLFHDNNVRQLESEYDLCVVNRDFGVSIKINIL